MATLLKVLKKIQVQVWGGFCSEGCYIKHLTDVTRGVWVLPTRRIDLGSYATSIRLMQDLRNLCGILNRA